MRVILIVCVVLSISFAGKNPGIMIAFCPDSGIIDHAMTRSAPFFAPDGSRQRLEVHQDSDFVARQGCRSLSVPVRAEDVIWIGPVLAHEALDPAEHVALQGSFDSSRVEVSEVAWGGGEDPVPSKSPFGKDLSKGARATVFGTERRARFENNVLSCGAGEAPAGVLLEFFRTVPARTQLSLRIEGTGQGHFGVAVSDDAGLHTESPEWVGEVMLKDGALRVSTLLLPSRKDGWAALTLTCPEGQGTFVVHSLVVNPFRPPPPVRSAWIWAPEAWAAPGELWEIVREERLSSLYLTVLVDQGEVSDSAVLREFIAEARRRGVEVWAVAGDPHDVLPEARPALLERTAAYLAYNLAVSSEARLAGMQLDIEPYLLPGFALAPGYWRERYLETYDAVRDVLSGKMALDMVVPVWWGTHPAWGEPFLRALAYPGTSVTVMNYRTHPDALRAGALPFLDAGDRHGYPVRIALETGPLPDETRRIYRLAKGTDPAELWLFKNEPVPFLLLLQNPDRDLPAIPYTLMHTRKAPATDLTFGHL